MKASEVMRWAYRHGASLDFKPCQEGVQLIVSVKCKKNVVLTKLILRNHDQAADDICRFIQRFADEKHLE